MKTMIMIPTYNEAENIGRLLDEILNLGLDVHIVVVDDNSPDGTANIVKSYSQKYKEVHLLLRKKNRGRGLAGIAGYIYALDHGAQNIIEMDADFSHQPKHIPQFIEALKEYEVVIGSRYIKGGKDLRKGIHRQLISRFANFYIRKVFGVNIKDCTSGYRGYRNYVLEGIGVRKFNTWGPAILSDVLYRIKLKGYSITEIPIEFIDRQRGKSTLTTKILLEGLINVIKLRLTVKIDDLQ